MDDKSAEAAIEVEFDDKATSQASESVEDASSYALREPRRSGRCLCLSLLACVLLVPAIVVGVVAWQLTRNSSEQNYRSLATCGDCHCNNGNDTCPAAPQTVWDEETVQALRTHRPLNPLYLACDPFLEDNCTLSEAQPSSGVCALHYAEADCQSGDYWLQTYPDADTAAATGGAVTHQGSCGVCSTTQDLAALMAHVDMQTIKSECGLRGMGLFPGSREQGILCFELKGFSRSCAELWMMSYRHLARSCSGRCLLAGVTNESYQTEECAPSECVACDEAATGATFARFAGRTRRRSGMVSSIVRPCEEIANVQHEACPTTQFLS